MKKNNLLKKIDLFISEKKYYIVAILLVILIFRIYNSMKPDTNKKVVDEINKKVEQEYLSENENQGETNQGISEHQIQAPEYREYELRKKYYEALKINPDTKAWIKIDNSNIDFPVLQASDNDFYLKHNILKEEDKNGAIYLDYEVDLDKNPENIIIYGHNMLNTDVFSDLTKYKKIDYLKSHPTIRLYYDGYEYQYKVLGGFIIDINSKERYFPFNAYIYENDKFNSQDYIKKAKSLKKVWTDENVEIKKDSKLLSLSTCTYEYKNARFILVAVRQ